MYNEVLNLIGFGIELLNQFLKKKRGVALRVENGINLGEKALFLKDPLFYSNLFKLMGMNLRPVKVMTEKRIPN